MRVGSIVETLVCFESQRREWGFDYPSKGDILTVSNIEDHPLNRRGYSGFLLLYFEEHPTLVGLSNKNIKEEYHFKELLPPMDIEEKINIDCEQEIEQFA